MIGAVGHEKQLALVHRRAGGEEVEDGSRPGGSELVG